MSEIPPDISSSAAQAGFQAREVAKERDARRSQRTDAARQQARTVDEAGNVVETGDDDVSVFADAEGAGGRGRAFEQENQEEEKEPDPKPEEGITRDDDGQLHIDLEA